MYSYLCVNLFAANFCPDVIVENSANGGMSGLKGEIVTVSTQKED